MMRSMFSAVSGLRNHQVFMDVVGNNIANVNTPGFRASRVTFQDILSQSLRGPSAPRDGRGGSNAIQVGLGTVLASTDIELSQGNLLSTGKSTDMAIQGDGWFMLSDSQQVLYSRAGAFDIDAGGRLVSPASGLMVQGWQADDAGDVDTSTAIGSIIIPIGQNAIAKASETVSMSGNLNSTAAVADTVQSSIGVYDAQGNRHNLTFTFTKGGNNQWSWSAAADPADTTVTSITPSPVATAFTFTSDGQFDKTANVTQWDDDTSLPLATITVAFNNGIASMVSKVDLSKLTQLAQTGDLANQDGNVTPLQDGSPQGTLSSFSVGPKGNIIGVYSNGLNRGIGQIAVASFTNPAGLVRVGSSMFSASASSGDAQIGSPNTGGRGSLSSGFLEQSNVDLAQQFTNLIMAERGFQANSRVITATDEMLQDLANLKR